MATRAVAETIFFINAVFDLESRRRIGGAEIQLCKVMATINSPSLPEKVTVLYIENSRLSPSGVGDYMRINVIQPFKWEHAFCHGAKLRCIEVLCRKIDEVYQRRQLLNSGHSV